MAWPKQPTQAQYPPVQNSLQPSAQASPDRQMTQEEYCAMCELKQLVNKVGSNLCSPKCKVCSPNGGNVRPATAQPAMNYTQCTPSGDGPAPKVVPTYQWPAYTTGYYYYPNSNYYSRGTEREHPYLPVNVCLPQKTDQRPPEKSIPRTKSAHYVRNAELRASILVGCECTKKNGLQDTCPKLVCKDLPPTGTRDNPKKIKEEIVKEPIKEEPVKEKMESQAPTKEEKKEILLPVIKSDKQDTQNDKKPAPTPRIVSKCSICRGSTSKVAGSKVSVSKGTCK